MEVEIGSGYVCSPCTMARFGVCKEYPGEELSYEMRCDQCLEKWPAKEAEG
jgi:hypothetical protein